MENGISASEIGTTTGDSHEVKLDIKGARIDGFISFIPDYSSAIDNTNQHTDGQNSTFKQWVNEGTDSLLTNLPPGAFLLQKKMISLECLLLMPMEL